MAKQGNLRINRSAYIVRTLLLIVLALILVALGLAFGFNLMRQLEPESPLGYREYTEVEVVEEMDVDTAPVSDEEKDEYAVAPDRPRYLFMPSIGIDKARVIEIGVSQPNENGSQQMEAPKGISDVGWYNCQKNPIADKRCAAPQLPAGGNTESAVVMDGHTCFSQSVRCVFDNLKNIRNGDKVTVEMGDGTKVDYVVKKVEIKELSDVDMSELMKPVESGKEGLNFISCTGQYRSVVGANGALTSSHRVLVYTVRE